MPPLKPGFFGMPTAASDGMPPASPQAAPAAYPLQDVTVGILAGGQSRRMGQSKASLLYKGVPFVAHIAARLSPVAGVMLSAPRDSESHGLALVPDVYPGHGPVGGLHALLARCPTPWLLAVSCDAPLFTAEAALWLYAHTAPGLDAVVPVTPDGRAHPLCALWGRDAIPALYAQIASGENRVMGALKSVNTLQLPVQGSGISPRCFANINTPQDYAGLGE